MDALLARLCAALRHRGPDDHGTERLGHAGFAHTRLAILDRSPTGKQPMWSPGGGRLLLYNGEVYNHLEIKSELAALGERFVGTSDSEVVLRLLERVGASALSRFDGMFALAVYDPERKELLLARDRAGQKPLYVARVGRGWAFASELAALLCVPGIDTAVDRQGLSHLLSLGFLPSPYTMRSGIRQLEPGTWMRLRVGGTPAVGRFAPEPGPLDPRAEGDADEFVEPLHGLLSRCVEQHLVADVPVGVLLSGGVDSSVIAALAAKKVDRLHTFTLIHRDPRHDERKAARAVADHVGSEHHEIEVSDAPLTEEELDILVDHHGDPFADSASLNVLRLTRAMKAHVSVALSGDGGDEVFAGYRRVSVARYFDALAHIPSVLLEGGSRALSAVGGLRARQAARFLKIAGYPSARRAVAYTSLFWPEEQQALLRPDYLPASPGPALDTLLQQRGWGTEGDGAVADAHWLEQGLILPENMLVKIDRMSMVPAVEIRAPLLAGPVLDFAARLPMQAKHHRGVGKRVLRQLALRLAPRWTIERPKQGFSLPLEDYGGAVFEDAFRFAVEAGDSPLRALFRPEALDGLASSLRIRGEGRDPEDSPYRRVHRRWLLALLARTLVRQGSASV